MGRPSKLTPELILEICEYIENDQMYLQDACLLAGISLSSFYSWRDQGREGKQPYTDFLEATKRAEAQAKLNLVRHMKVNPKCWQLYMTIAERRFPAQWGKQDRVQHEQSGDFKVILEWSENGNGNGKRGK